MNIATPREHDFFIQSYCKAAGSVPLDTLRFGAFVFSVALYALFATPTPDHIGMVEGAIGALLLITFLRLELCNLWRDRRFVPIDWLHAGRAVLFFSVSVGLLGGVMQGNPQGMILRDLIWLGFIVMPVLLTGLLSARQYKKLVMLSVLAGCILALREILRVLGGDIAIYGGAEATAYLGNSPLVLFSAIMLAGYGLAAIIETPRRIIFALPLLVLSLVPLGVMVIGMQRASLGLFVVSLFIIGFSALRARPYRALPYLSAFIAIIFMFRQELATISMLMLDKTTQVGFNRRAEEWLAVWSHISGHPFGILFGTGWGGVYDSPAVGGMSVNFTHGALSSVLLKTGMSGLFVFGLYFYALGRKIWDNILYASNIRNLVFGLALLCPFLIDTFLYASFKSFDFGVLLVLMAFAPRLLGAKHQQILVSGCKSL